MATNQFARVTGVLGALGAGSWLTLAHRTGTIGDQDGAIGTGRFIVPVLLLLAGLVGLWTRHPARLEWAAWSVGIAACGGGSLLIAGQIGSPWNVEGATALPPALLPVGILALGSFVYGLAVLGAPGSTGSWPPPSCSAHPRRSLPSPPIGERSPSPSGSSSAPAGLSAVFCCSGGMRAPRSGRCGRSSARAATSRRRVMYTGA